MDWNNRKPMIDFDQVPPYYTGLVGDYVALIHKEVLDFVEDSMPGWAVERIEGRATSEYDDPGKLNRLYSEFRVRARSLKEKGLFMHCVVMQWDEVMHIEDVTMEVYR
jgi:hypothetical protein